MNSRLWTHLDFLSPGFSDQNMGGSSGTGWSLASYPRTGVDEEPDGEAFDRERPQGRGAPRHRKRRRLGRGGAGGCGQRRDALDLSLARFLRWQREAEERLLALEEARQEREARAEERRERLEQRRERLDRQHELRLFAVFASALSATRSGSSGPPDPFHPTNQPTWDAELPSLDPERAQHSICLSRRGSSFRQQKSIIQEGYGLYHADKHDPNSNPEVGYRCAPGFPLPAPFACLRGGVLGRYFQTPSLTRSYVLLPGHHQYGHQ